MPVMDAKAWVPVRKGRKIRKYLQDQEAVATNTMSSSMFACHALLSLRFRGGRKVLQMGTVLYRRRKWLS